MATSKKSVAKAPSASDSKPARPSASRTTAKKAAITKKATTSKKSPGRSTPQNSLTGKARSARSGLKRGDPPARTAKTKDPKGGLTQAGREYFKKTEGSHLKPGVRGVTDTPEKQKRKGSFLRRHFANPRGPMEKDGKPTRLALSAQAWGEPRPKNSADARKLAGKGKKLLEQYAAGKPKASKD